VGMRIVFLERLACLGQLDCILKEIDTVPFTVIGVTIISKIDRVKEYINAQ
jgi:hypothetical protein